jgi:hypothetical protein
MPRAFLGLWFACIAAVALTAAAANAQPGGRQDQCFLSSDVDGFQAPDDRTLYIRVGVNDVYRLDLMGDCPDLSFHERVGLQSTPGNPWICQPLDATVVIRETGIPARCPVTGIHKLTPAELAVLPKRDRP